MILSTSRLTPIRKNLALSFIRWLVRGISCGLFVIVTGCASSGETPLRYYLIEPAGNTTAISSDLAIEIVDLDIPDYLERVQIAGRRSDNQLRFADNHQWGENLRKNLTRTFARNLSRQLGAPDVGTPSQRSSSAPDYRVKLFIEQFEQGTNGHVILSARWQLIDTKRPNDIATHITDLASDRAISATDYVEIVSTMSSLFGTLSAEIADAIRNQAGGPAL